MTWSSINASDLSDGSQPDLGRYRIKYTITDSDGNEVIKYRIVTVQDTIAPTISLVGPTNDNLECGDTYSDPGATVTDNDPQASYTHNDTNTATGFTRTYTPSDRSGNTGIPVTRTVTVQDTTDPIVTLSGASAMIVEAGSSFSDPGATYFDTCDGSGTVAGTGTVDTAAVGLYTRSYTYTDGGGNSDTVTRTVSVVDTTAPVITLNGSASMTVANGGSFTDPGATWSDAVDGTGNITGSGSVNTSTAGTYTLTYSKTDSSGNTGTATRTVTVGAAPVNWETSTLNIYCSGQQAFWASNYLEDKVPQQFKELLFKSNANHSFSGIDVSDRVKWRNPDTGNIEGPFGASSVTDVTTEWQVRAADSNSSKLVVRRPYTSSSSYTLYSKYTISGSSGPDIFPGNMGLHVFDRDKGWSQTHFSTNETLPILWIPNNVGNHVPNYSVTKVTEQMCNDWHSMMSASEQGNLTGYWGGTAKGNTTFYQHYKNRVWYSGMPDENTVNPTILKDRTEPGDLLVLFWYFEPTLNTVLASQDISSFASTCPAVSYGDQQLTKFFDGNTTTISAAQPYLNKVPNLIHENLYPSTSVGVNTNPIYSTWNDGLTWQEQNSDTWGFSWPSDKTYAYYGTLNFTSSRGAHVKNYGKKLEVFNTGSSSHDLIKGSLGVHKFTGWQEMRAANNALTGWYNDTVVDSSYEPGWITYDPAAGTRLRLYAPYIPTNSQYNWESHP